MQWAEPVTGSSGMPLMGAKKRDTKSKPLPASAGAVTITPRTGSARRARKSGFRRPTSAALYNLFARMVGGLEVEMQ